MNDAYLTAYKCLDNVFRKEAFSTIELNGALEQTQTCDKALVTKIVYGVLDKNLQLEYVVGQFAKKVKPSIFPILKIGVYCLMNLSTPQHAIVNDCVDLAKAIGKGGVAGFINGVLLSVCRALERNKISFEENTFEQLSAKFSFPVWVIEQLSKDFGEEEMRSFIKYENDDTLTHIRLNPFKMTPEKFEKSMNENNVNFKKSIKDCYFVSGSKIKSLANDSFTIQSLSSILVCHAVGVVDGSDVLDVCAAPGGKSVLLAQLANCSVVACDLHPHRVSLIGSYARRMGVDNVKTVVTDGKKLKQEFQDKFDFVLCDVPCSGFGVVASKPDIKLFRKKEHLLQLAQAQAEILNQSSKAVKVGGFLTYSTCTVFKCENEEIVNEFLLKNKNFKSVEIKLPINFTSKNNFVQFLPHRDNIDGFFIAKMQRIQV